MCQDAATYYDNAGSCLTDGSNNQEQTERRCRLKRRKNFNITKHTARLDSDVNILKPKSGTIRYNLPRLQRVVGTQFDDQTERLVPYPDPPPSSMSH